MNDAIDRQTEYVSALYEEIYEDLVDIRDLANDAIESAIKDDAFPSGTINWGDLGCYEVTFYIDIGGGVGFNVYIEEASPDNAEFSGYISDYIHTKCNINLSINVITEW